MYENKQRGQRKPSYRLAMHDAEPAARDPHMYVVRPGGLEAGSIPARISFHLMVARTLQYSPATLLIPLGH